MLDTRVESLTKSDPTEKKDLENLFPGNVRVLEIRNFIEEEERVDADKLKDMKEQLDEL
ncbi:MAG: hypothetical protein KGY76_04885 [Candidatus Thermoplasmatota archaeon]|nr:hypothetical protein [Candidatus Thermoplasmatota archaeon]